MGLISKAFGGGGNPFAGALGKVAGEGIGTSSGLLSLTGGRGLGSILDEATGGAADDGPNSVGRDPSHAQRMGAAQVEVGDAIKTNMRPRVGFSDPSLPSHASALLATIAGPESSGNYNVRYTPKGGAEFAGTRHPRVREAGPKGPSDAAGAYQFLGSTWDEPGIGEGDDFGPAAQDRSGWRLAQRDYRLRTGRDLDADLQSGGLTPSMVDALTPTWVGLKSVPFETLKRQFDSAFSGKKGMEAPAAHGAKGVRPRSGGLADLVPSSARGSAPDLKNLRPEVASAVGNLQSAWGRELPIVSGFRGEVRNRKAGGARRSQHLHGNAVDIDVSNLSRAERLELIRLASAQGFTGIGVYSNSIHLDLGSRRAWGPDHHIESLPGWASSAVSEHLRGNAQSPRANSRVASGPFDDFEHRYATKGGSGASQRDIERAAKRGAAIAESDDNAQQPQEDGQGYVIDRGPELFLRPEEQLARQIEATRDTSSLRELGPAATLAVIREIGRRQRIGPAAPEDRKEV